MKIYYNIIEEKIQVENFNVVRVDGPRGGMKIACLITAPMHHYGAWVIVGTVYALS